VIVALKEEKHTGKLDSHAWFFEAFAEHVQPKYCILMDAGTVPTVTAMSRWMRSLDRWDPKSAGVCGELTTTYRPNFGQVTVAAAQHFEYKIANIWDRSTGPVFGFSDVLPGAFSAYRYEAVKAKEHHLAVWEPEGPLVHYFQTLTTPTWMFLSSTSPRTSTWKGGFRSTFGDSGDEKGGEDALLLMSLMYLSFWKVQFVNGLGNRPEYVSLVYHISVFCFEALMMVFTLILSLSPLFSLEMCLTRDENDCDEAKEDAAEGVVEGAEKKDRSAREETRGPSPASTVSARDYGPSETILMGGGGCTGTGVSISKANEVSESSESWLVRRHGVTMARLLLAVIALPGIDAVGVDSATLTTSPYGRVLNSYTPLTDSNVKTAAQLWVSNQASAASTYGLVHTWDLSEVTNMVSRCYYNRSKNNENIIPWVYYTLNAVTSLFLDITIWEFSFQLYNVSVEIEESLSRSKNTLTKRAR